MSSRPEARWTPTLVLTAVASVLGGCVPMGFQLSVINNPADIILTWCNESIISHYDVTLSKSQLEMLWSITVSINLVGGFIAAFTGSLIADRLGRKGALIIVNALNSLTAILFVTSRYTSSVEMLLVARLLAGMAGGLEYCIVPLYLTEVGHVTQRGTLGALIRLGNSMGIILGHVLSIEAILGNKYTWHFLLSACSVLTLTSSLIIFYIPESPKYLYVFRGDREKCIKALSRLRGQPADRLTNELEELEASHKTESETVNHSMYSVATSKELRMPLLLVIALQTAMMFSGNNALLFYSSRLLKDVGFSSAISSYVTLSLGCVDLCMSALSLVTVNHCRRRSLLLTSFSLMITAEILLTLALKYSNTAYWTGYACIALVVSVSVSFNVGLSIIPHFIAGELFVVGPASVAMCYASVVNWTIDFLVALSFPAMQQALGYLTFLPFTAMLALVATFTWAYLPETRNRNPSEIADRMKHGFCVYMKDEATAQKTAVSQQSYYNPVYAE